MINQGHIDEPGRLNVKLRLWSGSRFRSVTAA